MPEPDLTVAGGEYAFVWPSQKVGIRFARVHESKSTGMTGDVFITTTADGFGPHVRWERLNMSSSRMRNALANDLTGIMPLIPWVALLEYACTTTMLQSRQGEPVVEIGNMIDVPAEFVVADLILANNPTLIYAEGGSGKSLLALTLALHIEMGFDFLGRAVTDGPTLYLDYEFSREQHDKRLKLLANGMGFDSVPTLLYRRCSYALLEEAPQLERIIREHNVRFVVVDSAGAACGADPEAASAALGFWGGLRLMGVSALVLTHVVKDKRQRGPFGSSYWRNGARLSWELRADQAEGSSVLRMGLYGDKNNVTGRLRPLGIEWTFTQDAIQFQAWNPKLGEGYMERLTLAGKIEATLKETRKPMTTIQIAEELGAKDTVVRMTLNRNVDKFVHLGEGWGLLSRES